ncbi:MAG: response regulator [Pseudorhizobium pelagicum]|uniref:response regulator transcription factor n=1 Tax=Pseudorhizobium pelagicum TaxID=1509405 RepID=UPI00345F399C
MLKAETEAKSGVEPVVYIVDDDVEIREALLDLFLLNKRRAFAFASSAEFIELADTNAPGCLVVDLRMPDGNGIDLQSELAAKGSRLPVIFLTAYADVPTSVKAMKAGAYDFITKPFANLDLLNAVDHAIRRDQEKREFDAEVDHIRACLDTLTPREKEVMSAVVRGLMNKQIAYELGISEMTVKLHRMSVMRKMECRSLAALVRCVERIRQRD